MKISQLNIDGQTVAPPPGIPESIRGGITPLIQTSVNMLFYLGIFLAIVYLLYAGVTYITSGGDAEKLSDARKRIIYGIIGLVVVVSAFVIVRLFLGIFGGNSAQQFFLR